MTKQEIMQAKKTLKKALRGKTMRKAEKRVITFFLGFVLTMYALRSPAIYGQSKALQYLEGAYVYGGFWMMMAAVILVATGIVLASVIATKIIDILHKGYLSASFISAQIQQAKETEKLAKKIVYKRNLDAEWDEFRKKFDPIAPQMKEIAKRIDNK